MTDQELGEGGVGGYDARRQGGVATRQAKACGYTTRLRHGIGYRYFHWTSYYDNGIVRACSLTGRSDWVAGQWLFSPKFFGVMHYAANNPAATGRRETLRASRPDLEIGAGTTSWTGTTAGGAAAPISKSGQALQIGRIGTALRSVRLRTGTGASNMPFYQTNPPERVFLWGSVASSAQTRRVSVAPETSLVRLALLGLPQTTAACRQTPLRPTWLQGQRGPIYVSAKRTHRFLV